MKNESKQYLFNQYTCFLATTRGGLAAVLTYANIVFLTGMEAA
jgi:hypothetical protein